MALRSACLMVRACPSAGTRELELPPCCFGTDWTGLSLRLREPSDSFSNGSPPLLMSAQIAAFYSVLGGLWNPFLNVVAFEPVPPLFDSLKKNVLLNQLDSRIRSENLALSREGG